MNPLEGDPSVHVWHAAIASLLLTLLIGALALWKPRTGHTLFRSMENLFAHLAARKTRAVFLLFFVTLAVRLAVLPRVGVPVPGIHDEASYLLMADTFAHGRLANPPHPMWMSFETFHVNWFPTYSSMYPPAQGFVLALGQLLGHPWIGVLLSDAAMCAAILWMLQAWLPPRWALLGSALAAINFGIASYWMNSYWGGAVAASGGALVLGALPRIIRRASVRNALLLGLGLAILANSRPYEGLLFCIPAAVGFLRWLFGKSKPGGPARARISKVFLPLAGVLVLTAAFMAYYNWRLTGHALLMPHILNTRTYHTASLFLWEHAKPEMRYNNRQFEDFYTDWERDNYQTTWSDALRVSTEKLGRFSLVFFWPGLLFALPGFPFAFRDKKMRFLVITFLACAAGIFVVTWSQPHYAAPMTGVLFALIVQSMRHLRAMRWRARSAGPALSRALVLTLVVWTAVNVARGVCDPLWWPCMGDPGRATVLAELMHTPGKHLVVVRYGDDHNIHDEWVYNGADLDGAKVLWARELSPEQNARLFAYFKDRQIWLIEPDIDNTEFRPYSPPRQ